MAKPWSAGAAGYRYFKNGRNDGLPRNGTIQFEEVGVENLCDPRTRNLTPCIITFEQACNVTIIVRGDNEGNGELANVLWRGTCRENYEYGKLRRHYTVKNAHNYNVFWGKKHSNEGGSYKRQFTLEKNKVEGKKKDPDDSWTFDVEGCTRKEATLDSKSCKGDGGSCTGTFIGPVGNVTKNT